MIQKTENEQKTHELNHVWDDTGKNPTTTCFLLMIQNYLKILIVSHMELAPQTCCCRALLGLFLTPLLIQPWEQFQHFVVQCLTALERTPHIYSLQLSPSCKRKIAIISAVPLQVLIFSILTFSFSLKECSAAGCK